jgi:hypothetical protein
MLKTTSQICSKRKHTWPGLINRGKMPTVACVDGQRGQLNIIMMRMEDVPNDQ